MQQQLPNNYASMLAERVKDVDKITTKGKYMQLSSGKRSSIFRSVY